MTSKEALEIFYKDVKNYNNDMRKYPAYYFDKPKNEEMLRKLEIKQNEMYVTILGGLEILEKLEAKTHLLFKDRKTISKEFDKWCVDNNVLNCSENMVTWFLTIKLKEWLENEKNI